MLRFSQPGVYSAENLSVILRTSSGNHVGRAEEGGGTAFFKANHLFWSVAAKKEDTDTWSIA